MKKHLFIISVTNPEGKVMTLDTVVKYDPLDALKEMRNQAFDKAASGRCGQYPSDKTLHDAVEAGFSDDGACWKSNNGTLIEMRQIS